MYEQMCSGHFTATSYFILNLIISAYLNVHDTMSTWRHSSIHRTGFWKARLWRAARFCRTVRLWRTARLSRTQGLDQPASASLGRPNFLTQLGQLGQPSSPSDRITFIQAAGAAELSNPVLLVGANPIVLIGQLAVIGTQFDTLCTRSFEETCATNQCCPCFFFLLIFCAPGCNSTLVALWVHVADT